VDQDTLASVSLYGEKRRLTTNEIEVVEEGCSEAKKERRLFQVSELYFDTNDGASFQNAQFVAPQRPSPLNACSIERVLMAVRIPQP